MTLVVVPRVSEKSYQQANDNGVYTFIVPKGANRHDIKSFVEEQYEVTVTGVNISILKGKTKRFSQKRGRSSIGKRADTKKAYVTLKKGDKIPVFNPDADRDNSTGVTKGDK